MIDLSIAAAPKPYPAAVASVQPCPNAASADKRGKSDVTTLRMLKP